ncbi:MAG: hypothetical protein WB760_26140 [Xanthobacteraceae bacterium]
MRKSLMLHFQALSEPAFPDEPLRFDRKAPAIGYPTPAIAPAIPAHEIREGHSWRILTILRLSSFYVYPKLAARTAP